jgi:hypothetical protein
MIRRWPAAPSNGATALYGRNSHATRESSPTPRRAAAQSKSDDPPVTEPQLAICDRPFAIPGQGRPKPPPSSPQATLRPPSGHLVANQ